MSFFDYIWIIKLVIEILKLLADMNPEDRVAIHNLKDEIGEIFDGPKATKRTKKTT